MRFFIFCTKIQLNILPNNVYYIDKEDAISHDVLLQKMVNLKKHQIGRGRGFRFGFPNDEFYFKSQDEMKVLLKTYLNLLPLLKKSLIKLKYLI